MAITVSLRRIRSVTKVHKLCCLKLIFHTNSCLPTLINSPSSLDQDFITPQFFISNKHRCSATFYLFCFARYHSLDFKVFLKTFLRIPWWEVYPPWTQILGTRIVTLWFLAAKGSLLSKEINCIPRMFLIMRQWPKGVWLWSVKL